jgi:hypothetical protein
MVGIGGGAPTRQADVRLDDVVVSRPSDTYSGVVQYDYGKTVRGGRFQQVGTLNKPPQILLNAIAHLEADHQMGERQISRILSDILAKNTEKVSFFSSPGVKQDRLFKTTYDHVEYEEMCEKCEASESLDREPRISDEP